MTDTDDVPRDEIIEALIGMVVQDLDYDGEGYELEREYGIKPPHKRYVARHLGFHAQALRVLGRLGIMDVDDRGGRCVMAEFKVDAFGGLVNLSPDAWEDVGNGIQRLREPEERT